MSEKDAESTPEGPLGQGEVFVYSEENFGGQQQRIKASVPGIKPEFPVASIRLGPKTGITLFAAEGETGLSQDLTAELSTFAESRLQGQKPKSLQIWSTAERPFRGYWAIEVSPGRYLSAGIDGMLATSARVSGRESFRLTEIIDNRGVFAFTVREAPDQDKMPAEPPQFLTIADLQKVALANEPEAGFRTFSLLSANDQWIGYDAETDRFSLTTEKDKRALLCQSIKIAEDESQVGELAKGEVALYENPAYWGKAWVFCTDYADFGNVVDLNDEVSSIQLGPLTGVTIYREAQFQAGDLKAGKQDVVTHVPALKAEQVGEDKISSMDMWRIVPPEGTGVNFSCKLSQDFHGDGKDFKEYSAYRTTLKFSPFVEQVEIWATDATDLEINGAVYSVSEDKSVILPPNGMQRMVIASDAVGPASGQPARGCLKAPGLKLHANTMLPDERIVIHPDQEVHQRLANLEDGELWNAKFTDDRGVQQSIFRQGSWQKPADVDNAQSMITKVMSTVKYTSDALGGSDQRITNEGLQGRSWALDFSTYRVKVRALNVREGPGVHHKRVGYLLRNQVVEVLGFNVNGDWICLRRVSDGLTGWSASAYLSEIGETDTGEEEYRVTAKALQIREGPGTEFRNIGMLQQNEIVISTGTNDKGTWRKITRSDGLTGWSAARYLAPVQPEPPLSFALAEAAQPHLAPAPELSGLAPNVRFREISQEEVQALLARAEFPDAGLAQGFFDFCEDIYNGVKSAVSVVITAVKDAWAVIVNLGEQVKSWIVDTAEKAIACVEGIIEKIGAIIEEIVKWLRMIFEWRDILHTRDYLRDSINISLVYMGKKLGEAKGPVSRFFEEQEHFLTDAINQAITALGGDAATPTPETSSGPSEVLEAVNWVLSKVMGGIIPPFGSSSLFAGSTTAEGEARLQAFWQGTFAKAVRVVSALPEAMAHTAASLMKYPTQPLLVIAELLKIIRNLLTNLFDLGEELILGLFDLGAYLIQNLKAVLSARIRIPFISDLLEWVGRLLGQNWDITLGFSILDAATLILAIPVTILSKIQLGRAPFKIALPLAAGANEWTITAGLAGFMGGLVDMPLDMVPETEKGMGWPGSILEVLSLVFSITGLVFSWGPDIVSMSQGDEDQMGAPQAFAWGFLLTFETGLLLLDIVSLIYSGRTTNTAERLKRFEKSTIIMASAAGFVHLIMFVVKDWEDPLDLIPDCLTTLPEAFSALRLSKNPYASVAFGVIDGIAAETALVAGMVG